MNAKPSYEELERQIDALKEKTDYDRQLLNDILNYIPDFIFIKDEQHRWVVVNDAFCRALGHPREELIGKTDYDFHQKEEADVFWEKDNEVFESGGTNINEEFYTTPNGDVRTILTSKTAFMDKRGRKLLVGISHDISERIRNEQEKEALIQKLRQALDQVKQLSGFLPICTSCKKIRDDRGYWKQIEAYIREHSEAQFSHSLCPDCLKKLYPDYDPDRKGEGA